MLTAVLLGAVLRTWTLAPSGSEIVISASERFAGAIYSLRWKGKEFLDAADHGRLLQSASNFDAGTPITNETYNPTEGGSRRDGDGPTSTSKLIRVRAKGNVLETSSAMAFWLNPGEESEGNPAKNTTPLSEHLLDKKVVVGFRGNPRRIRYEVTFRLPRGETHGQAVFESLTGYMPAEFSRFYRQNPTTYRLEPLDDGPGEQERPVVFSTEDGAYAMGIYSPDPAPKGYGRFRFDWARVVKWNCVFRVKNPRPGGRYRYQHDVLVGTRAQVEEDLARLAKGQR